MILRAETAPKVMGALRTEGLDIPGDVSVALWGHAPWRSLVEPLLSSIEIDHRAVGAATAAHLLARLAGEIDHRAVAALPIARSASS